MAIRRKIEASTEPEPGNPDEGPAAVHIRQVAWRSPWLEAKEAMDRDQTPLEVQPEEEAVAGPNGQQGQAAKGAELTPVVAPIPAAGLPRALRKDLPNTLRLAGQADGLEDVRVA